MSELTPVTRKEQFLDKILQAADAYLLFMIDNFTLIEF